MKDKNPPTFKQVIKHFNITRNDGSLETEKRGSYLEPIDAYKIGKVVMRMEREIELLRSNRRNK